MKRKLNEIIYTVSRYTEILLSAVILLVIVILIIPMVHNFITIPLLEITAEQFTAFLGDALTLLIGVEFVKMLAKHTAENLLEVLMFAIARQMVVEHLNMTETLIGVVAIAVIFSIRKFLLLKTSDSAEKTNYKSMKQQKAALLPAAQKLCLQPKAPPPLFSFLFISPDNSSFAQIVWGHLNGHLISRKNTDKIHSQLSADVC